MALNLKPFNFPPKTDLSTVGEILARWFDERDIRWPLPILARTCGSFTEPMLRAIWRRIPNIHLLFFSLPDGAWDMVDESARGGALIFRVVSHLSYLPFSF